MREEIKEKLNMFRIYNDITLKNEIVVFGSTYAGEFPFYELSKKYLLSNAIYNRSINGMTLDEALMCLDSCVIDIKPSKVFLSLGEHDLNNKQAISVYGDILNKIKEKLPFTEIYVMPVYGNSDVVKQFNEQLKMFCLKTKTEYMDLRFYARNEALSYSRVFSQMVQFFRKSPLNFIEAMELAN